MLGIEVEVHDYRWSAILCLLNIQKYDIECHD